MEYGGLSLERIPSSPPLFHLFILYKFGCGESKTTTKTTWSICACCEQTKQQQEENGRKEKK